jgi:hypothetical protein
MKFEISYVCYQYLGCSWVTCWRNNLGIKKIKKKNMKRKEKKRIKRKKERENNIDHFELFAEYPDLLPH